MVYNVQFELRNGKVVAFEIEATGDAQANDIAVSLIARGDVVLDSIEPARAA